MHLPSLHHPPQPRPPCRRHAAGRVWLTPLLLFATALGVGALASVAWMHRHPVVVKALPSDSAASLDAQRRALPVPTTSAGVRLPPAVTPAPDSPHVVANTPPPASPAPVDVATDGAETRQGTMPPAFTSDPDSRDHGPRLSEHTPPAYPPQALRERREGTVRLQLSIDADGNVVDARVVHGSGSGLLDRAALDNARSWRYQPAEQGGQPVPSKVEVPIDFRLDGN